MTKQELEASNRSYDILAAIAIGMAVMMLSAFGFLAFCALGGRYGICGGTSKHWDVAGEWMFLLSPIFGIVAGVLAGRRYRRLRAKKLLAANEPAVGGEATGSAE